MRSVRQVKTKNIAEFGDFQTPKSLAHEVTDLLARLGIRPNAILEPTCGRGAFIEAAANAFPEANKIIGVDINRDHLAKARALAGDVAGLEIKQGDFFRTDWSAIIGAAADPWLIIGNPPWVTSSELGGLESSNLPEKSNFQGHTGIDAITGKSNFDISEWMILRYLDWLNGRRGTIAILCKTAVARKILRHAWRNNYSTRSARIYRIDAFAHFAAAVDACLFVIETGPGESAHECLAFESLSSTAPARTIGFDGTHLISDAAAFERRRNLMGKEPYYVWRSGVKHDCSKVMELKRTANGYENGLGEQLRLEEKCLYPMLKSSDLGNGRLSSRGAMIVPQQTVGQDTQRLRAEAPRTWEYLNRHKAAFDRRGSTIYRDKPPFSIFGVGAYTFSPWKVAISGFYKNLQFARLGPENGQPVVFDDTIYFLPCWSEQEAVFLSEILMSEPAQQFFDSMVNWDEKRPITVDLLKRLSIAKLSESLGRAEEYEKHSRGQAAALLAAKLLKGFEMEPRLNSA